MRQQLERDEKRRHRDEKRRQRKVLLLLFLWLIAFLVGIVLAGWLWALNYYLVCIPASLAFIAYLVDFVIKGIKTGELRATTDGGSAVITKRKNEPKKFWFYVYFNLVSALGIWLGIFYWIFIGAG